MKRSSLPSVRMARLDEIGFVCAPREAAWEAMFNELKRYRDKNGHCNVPHGWKQNPKLARWIGTQRTRWRRLTSVRRARLEGLGFLKIYD